MSIQTLNISTKNISGKCNLKCSYSFKYSESNLTAKNDGIMITLTYDTENNSPVVYNGDKYNVGSIMITSPSIHIFDGQPLPGEMIITHNPIKGGKLLEVCIPFKTSGDITTASQIITNIIEKVSVNAPSEGDSTNLNMSNFNLDNIIPKNPYYSYTQNQSDWIVFGALEAISLSSTTINTLQKIIKPYPINIPSTNLFYNPNGPTSGLQIGDGIYISCKPTGSSEETTAVEYDKTSSSTDFSNIFESDAFKLTIVVIIGCILFILIFFGINTFYNYLSTDKLTVAIPTFAHVNGIFIKPLKD
jgi:carbonic anhydrase